VAKVTVNRLDGFIGKGIRYHYDIPADVMYARLAAKMGAESYGEETDEGFILLRSLDEDSLVGVTIVGYWERFGHGRLEDAPVSDVVKGVRQVAERMLTPAA